MWAAILVVQIAAQEMRWHEDYRKADAATKRRMLQDRELAQRVLQIDRRQAASHSHSRFLALLREPPRKEPSLPWFWVFLAAFFLLVAML